MHKEKNHAAQSQKISFNLLAILRAKSLETFYSVVWDFSFYSLAHMHPDMCVKRQRNANARKMPWCTFMHREWHSTPTHW